MNGQVSFALAIVRCATTYPLLERYPREDVFISVRSQPLLPARLLGLPFCPSLVGFVYNTVCYRRLAALELLLDTFAVDERSPRRDWQQEDAHIQSSGTFCRLCMVVIACTSWNQGILLVIILNRGSSRVRYPARQSTLTIMTSGERVWRKTMFQPHIYIYLYMEYHTFRKLAGSSDSHMAWLGNTCYFIITKQFHGYLRRSTTLSTLIINVNSQATNATARTPARPF